MVEITCGFIDVCIQCITIEIEHFVIHFRSEDVSDMLISEEEYSRVQSALSDMMCTICDHAHDRSVKVIVARAKVSTHCSCGFK